MFRRLARMTGQRSVKVTRYWGQDGERPLSDEHPRWRRVVGVDRGALTGTGFGGCNADTRSIPGWQPVEALDHRRELATKRIAPNARRGVRQRFYLGDLVDDAQNRAKQYDKASQKDKPRKLRSQCSFLLSFPLFRTIERSER